MCENSENVRTMIIRIKRIPRVSLQEENQKEERSAIWILSGEGKKKPEGEI